MLQRSLKVFARHSNTTVFTTLSRASGLQAVKRLIVLKNGELSLWKQHALNKYEMVSQVKLPTRDYNILKQISHLPVYIQTLLLPNDTLSGKELLKQKKPQLLNIYHTVSSLCRSIRVSDENSENQLSVLKKTLMLLKELISHPEDQDIQLQDKLDHYLQSVSHELNVNKELASYLQLSNLNKVMQDFRDTDEMDLKDTHVVIVGPQGPRVGLIEKQFFQSLYQHEVGSLENVHYAEVLPKDIPAIDVEKDVIRNFLSKALVKASNEEVYESKSTCPHASSSMKKLTCPLEVVSSSESSLGKLNKQFLKAHHDQSKTMLRSIKTILIYDHGVLSCLQQNPASNKYDLTQKRAIRSEELDELVKTLDLRQTRMVICGDDHDALQYSLDVYRQNGISEHPENDFVYSIESAPKDKDIVKHVVENFLPAAELNKVIGERMTGDRKLMFSDVLSDQAPAMLKGMFR